MQTSAVSHFASFDGRHTCCAGANPQLCVQQALLSGSHTALFLNLHVAALQQLESTPRPGSQSSPVSTMPLPHIWREMVCLVASPGSMRQVVLLPEVIMEPVMWR